MSFLKNRTLCFLFFIIITSSFLVEGTVLAKEVKEHPLIRPFPGSVFDKNLSKYQKFNKFDFWVKNKKTNARETVNVKGEYYYLLYEVRTGSGDRVKDISKTEYFENYRTAAEEKGGKVVYEDQVYMVFTLPKSDGGTTWCRLNVVANMGQQYLHIIDEKGMKQSITFGPKELKDALDKDGKVLLYGIFFDLDKASLKPKSVEQLMHMVTLMQTYPDLYLEVQGHTDSQGSDEYNMTLSDKRAGTVCTFLELFGIDPGRLVPKGYGETMPVASNDTKEGRAKNRRVELVKITPDQAQSNYSRVQASTAAAPVPSPASNNAGAAIIGKWQMPPTKRVKTGTMTFSDISDG